MKRVHKFFQRRNWLAFRRHKLRWIFFFVTLFLVITVVPVVAQDSLPFIHQETRGHRYGGGLNPPPIGSRQIEKFWRGTQTLGTNVPDAPVGSHPAPRPRVPASPRLFSIQVYYFRSSDLPQHIKFQQIHQSSRQIHNRC